MRCICSECGMLYDLKEPIDNDQETHGFCDECFEIITSNLKKRKEKEDGRRS